ncbi:MAG: alpha/beta hydrolase [Clostridia bacterium]|nr:alpha/beta hydrolase [Clostridia bacterium]
MKSEVFDLWNSVPGMCEEIPKITAYVPENKKSDGAVVIFPGGGYGARAPHEGEGYAEFLNAAGITAFVVDYRVSPHRFPCQLLDARRGVKFARFYAEKYGIDKNKIAVMGSSAGGHLAALVSTYFDDVDCEVEQDEIEKECFIPNGQILCYPVIRILGKEIAHFGTGANLLGNERHAIYGEDVQPDMIASERTPQAFIWHTAADGGVSVLNSYEYATALKRFGIDVEMHIFPHGRHGLGACTAGIQGEDENILTHNVQWTELLIKWLRYTGLA